MANIKIAQLTNQINISDTDLILIESAASTNKMTVAKLKEQLFINGGGIIESMNTANGRYVKYADGTMECFHTSARVSSASGSIDASFEFPASFNGYEPVVIAQLKAIGHENWNGSLYQGTTSDVSVRLVCVGLTPGQNYALSYIARGKYL